MPVGFLSLWWSPAHYTQHWTRQRTQTTGYYSGVLTTTDIAEPEPYDER